ncbi:MAG: hypothetical protein ACKOXB_11745 [Flavobacteriales bacterium]
MTGVFFTARLGSTRLRSKHLIKAGAFTFLEWMIKRYAHAFASQIARNKVKLIITTSVNPENREFEKYASALGIEVFYGSDDNIPLRHLQCAKHYGISSVISIDGDDILCSAEAALKIHSFFEKNQNAGFVKTTGLPLGMNVAAYTTAYLEECLSAAKEKKLETGWGRIFDETKTDTLHFPGYENDGDLRLTLDYEDDARFFAAVIGKLEEKTIGISDKDLIQIIRENNYSKINSHLSQQYWNNFDAEKRQEQQL